MFNRDAQSAVSLVTDALRGSTRILELFRNLANGSGQRSDAPLEMRNIDTLKMAFPFLQTDDDKRLILSCKSRLKELENSKNPKSENAARLLRSAVIKHTAVLRRKEEQQRNFLTKLNEINSNVREAEKLFSSDGFAEQALREAEELMEGTPPDDDIQSPRSRRRFRVRGLGLSGLAVRTLLRWRSGCLNRRWRGRGFQSRKRIRFIMDIFGMERNGSMKCCFF